MYQRFHCFYIQTASVGKFDGVYAVIACRIAFKEVADGYFIGAVFSRNYQIVAAAGEVEVALFPAVGKADGVFAAFACVVVRYGVFAEFSSEDVGVAAGSSF